MHNKQTKNKQTNRTHNKPLSSKKLQQKNTHINNNKIKDISKTSIVKIKNSNLNLPNQITSEFKKAI